MRATIQAPILASMRPFVRAGRQAAHVENDFQKLAGKGY